VPFGKRREGDLAEVRNHLHADAPCSSSPLLHRDRDQNRFATFELAAATQPGLRTADPGVVEFDIAVERFARRVHHRASKFVQQQPGGLVPPDRQLTLEQQGRDPCRRVERFMSVLPSSVMHSRLRQVWDVTSDLLIATAPIWTLPLLLGAVGAVVKLLF
jgi:hypothetical protein